MRMMLLRSVGKCEVCWERCCTQPWSQGVLCCKQIVLACHFSRCTRAMVAAACKGLVLRRARHNSCNAACMCNPTAVCFSETLRAIRSPVVQPNKHTCNTSSFCSLRRPDQTCCATPPPAHTHVGVRVRCASPHLILALKQCDRSQSTSGASVSWQLCSESSSSLHCHLQSATTKAENGRQVWLEWGKPAAANWRIDKKRRDRHPSGIQRPCLLAPAVRHWAVTNKIAQHQNQHPCHKPDLHNAPGPLPTLL